MKKLLTISLLLSLSFTTIFAGCFGTKNTVHVGASAKPHAQILEFIKEDYEALGYKLEIHVYTDYVMPNKSLASKDLDANYFQHLPYLNEYNKQFSTNLISACAVHYEPMGIFGKNVSDINSVPNNVPVIIPADSSNQARALLLLAEYGLITLKTGVESTKVSILDVENSFSRNLVAVEPATIPAQLNNADSGAIAVINGNYALASGLSLEDALATENEESAGTKAYANILAINQGDENREEIKALITLLTSDKVKEYITQTFNGAVLPV